MGIFNLGKDDKEEAAKKEQEIRGVLTQALGGELQNIRVDYDDGTARISGSAKWHATRERVEQLVNSIKDVKKVDAGGITVQKQEAAAPAPAAKPAAAPALKTYTVKDGDTLSAISKEFYGDANQWQRIYEANRDVLKDPDMIQPGQHLRIPS